MKRKIFAIILTAASTCSAWAQSSIFNSPELNKVHFGARLSYELAIPTDVQQSGVKADLFNPGSGFALGAICNVPIYQNLYLESGLTINYNTFKADAELTKAIIDDKYQVNLDITSASVRQWGVTIPVHFGYNFDFLPDIRLALFTGPEFYFGLKSRLHMGMGKLSAEANTFGSDGLLNRYDVKWRIGVGATYKTNYHVAISGAPGLCDMWQNAPTMHTNLFDITLGYNF